MCRRLRQIADISRGEEEAREDTNEEVEELFVGVIQKSLGKEQESEWCEFVRVLEEPPISIKFKLDTGAHTKL